MLYHFSKLAKKKERLVHVATVFLIFVSDWILFQAVESYKIVFM